VFSDDFDRAIVAPPAEASSGEGLEVAESAWLMPGSIDALYSSIQARPGSRSGHLSRCCTRRGASGLVSNRRRTRR